MTDIPIVRKQVVVVDSVGENQYHDLTFKDKAGVEYKIGNKRIGYFKDKIIAGQAVQLNYAMSSFGKEYIYSAELVKDKIPEPIETKTVPISPPLKPDHLVEEVKKIGATVILDQNEIKNRAVAVSYSKDLAVAGKIELKQLKEYADKFLAYIKGE